MSSQAINTCFLIGIPICALGLTLLIACRYRRDALCILSRHAFNEPTPEEICSALGRVNACCGAYSFGVEGTANILFRGQKVTLVLGPVGRLTGSFAGKVSLGPNWNASARLFALADTAQTEWMTANSDVFEAAHLGAPFSVFWVRIKALKA